MNHSEDCLFIFLDESGNLDFSPNGTNHYVLAAVTAIEPLSSSTKMQDLKYAMLEQGIDVEHFHASEDKQTTRDVVFPIINQLRNIHINYIYANKHYAHPKYHNNAAFYGLLGKTLLSYLFRSYHLQQYARVIVVFDKALTKKEQNTFLKMVKPELKQTGKPYAIYFHRTLSDFNGQIADYAAWAKYVALERSEYRPLTRLCDVPIKEFNIFRRGTREYY